MRELDRIRLATCAAAPTQQQGLSQNDIVTSEEHGCLCVQGIDHDDYPVFRTAGQTGSFVFI